MSQQQKNFNFFLLPIADVNIDTKYSLQSAHTIIEVNEYVDFFSFLALTDFERYILSEIVNMKFIFQNFKIVDNKYVQILNSIDYSIFLNISKCISSVELCKLLEHKFEGFIFKLNKIAIVDLMNKIKAQSKKETIYANLIKLKPKERPEKIDHIEHFLIKHKRINTGLSIQECIDTYLKEDYDVLKYKFEEMLVQLDRPMSNILPYYYTSDYAKKLLTPYSFSRWEFEKECNTHNYTIEEIIEIEAKRLISGLDIPIFNRIITYPKHRKRIWAEYNKINNTNKE